MMLRLPRALLSLETAERYCIDPHAAAWTRERGRFWWSSAGLAEAAGRVSWWSA